MKIEDLSTRVAGLADAKTKAEIRAVLDPAWKLVRDSNSEELVKILLDTAERYRTGGGTHMNWNWVFEKLQELMFEHLRERRRCAYVTEFLEKIERLDAEVSEIKSGLENQ